MMERDNTINQNVMLNSSSCSVADSSHERQEDHNHGRTTSSMQISLNKIRLVANYLTLLGRLVIPVFLAAYSAWLRNQRSVVDGIRKQFAAPGIIAVIAGSVSLSALSRAIAIPCGKIDPLLRVLKTNSGKLGLGLLIQRPQDGDNQEAEPEKSVKCDVLHDPGTDEVRADVIFIHGLHGSLEKTWRQGLWDHTQGINVPLKRNNSCYTISNRGNPAIISFRKQSTFIHTDTILHGILNQSETTTSKEVTGVTFDVGATEFEESDIEVCKEAMAMKVDAIINGVSEQEHEPTDSETGSYSPCWPRDWLPIDCPGVRVIALNYSTDPFLWRPLWVTKRIRSSMMERGREMMEQLQKIGVGNNPIVWVGHSKGGLFIKQMIVDAYESGNKMWSGIFHNTKGIMFYSVPHRGSPCADINLPLTRKSVEVTEVQKDCQEVLELHDKFISLIDKNELQAEIYSFIETIQTFMSIMYIQIVSLETADPGVGKMSGVPVDHRNICKPTSRECFLYKELTNLINNCVGTACESP